MHAKAARGWVWWMPAAALGAFACAAHSGGGGSTSQPYADVNAYAQARGAAECNALVVQKCAAKDAGTCAAKRAATILALVPQGTTYVPQAAQACLDAVTAAYADAVITSDEMSSIDNLCGPKLFSGPGAARAQCLGPYDCASAQGLTCFFPLTMQGQAQTGQCLVPNPVGAASPCPGEADQCPDNYFCDPKAKVCTPAGLAGQACYDLQPCAKGMTCPLNPFGAVCQPKFGDGHGCQGDADCQNGMCDKASAAPQGNCASTITLTSLDSLCAVYQ